MPLLRPVPFLTLLATFLIVDAHLYTLFIPGWGMAAWQYNATFLALSALALAARTLLVKRRVASLALTLTGIVTVASSAVLLFARAPVLRHDLLDWLTYWHATWSWAFGLALVAHLARNATRLGQFARLAPTRVVTGTWALLAVGAAATAAPDAWHALPRDGHAARVLAATAAILAVGAVAWARAGRGHARRRERPLRRKPRRALVDVNLVAVTTLVFATGFLVLYLDSALRSRGLLRASVFWHSVTSGVLVAFALVHALTNGRALRAHAARVAREASGERWRAR